MSVTIYGIKNCDTMKKAFAWLDKHGVEYAFHDYKKDGVPAERLKAWSGELGWEKLANTRGPTWRMLRPTSSRQSGRSLEACTARSRLSIDFSLKPGSSPSFSASSE